ncbi:MAG: response regulator transcription factor [Bacteroidales bacterium]|nr:response regulator transcription factor [Bacteroidales bacterium]
MSCRCIIVEDEKPAQRVLQNYIEKVPALALVHVCNNALEALTYLQSHEVDLILLDINMPELSGLDFLKTLRNPPAVILTTAYSQYTLEGYEHGVMDYLLKPFSFERFMKAINRYFEMSGRIHKAGQSLMQNLMVVVDGMDAKIPLEEIVYIQAYGNYLKIFSEQKLFVIRETMADILERLPAPFIRIHRSYIVAINKVEGCGSHYVLINNQKLPLGNLYKHRFLEVYKAPTGNP